jgi:hypothetical protein
LRTIPRLLQRGCERAVFTLANTSRTTLIRGRNFELPSGKTAWTRLSAGVMMCSNPSLGRATNVVVWLRSLGLGKYEAVVRENEIDLTAEDLKGLRATASEGSRPSH